MKGYTACYLCGGTEDLSITRIAAAFALPRTLGTNTLPPEMHKYVAKDVGLTEEFGIER